jgi:6-phospho-beta-glucosidase
MKLTLIGAGVRSPLFAAAALRRGSRIGLDELALMDLDGERLALFTALVRQHARETESPVRITSSVRAEEALEGAGHVVVSIRVGGEDGRVLDEQIALRHGVLGQETTGPGGFAMALRNVPVVLRYADLLERLSPGAWLYSFTNPAGLVAQALHDRGFTRAIGICDGANDAQRAVARFLSIDARELEARVFGLNHLSWTSSVTRDGEELLRDLLADPAFRAATSLAMFDPELVAMLGMWPNAYLHYFYYAEQAVTAILENGTTRGEEVREITARLIAELQAADPDRDPEAALACFRAYHHRRGATYMAHARPDAPSGDAADRIAREDRSWEAEDEEGYAGVMLDVVEALETGDPLHTALNVPNAGAIEGMAADDVVEVSCLVDRDGVRALDVGAIPPAPLALMHAVKAYERLTVSAIQGRSRALAIEALMCHPLVVSYSRARSLVDAYLDAHRAHLQWE